MSTTSTPYFYGVYLLCSKSAEKRFAGRCYIGFTVNPNRRINQHNRGKEFGGARRTNNKGPWQMVMIIHGFPNNIAALQFEWAWQQPTLSTRLKAYPELRRKSPKESYFQYNFRVLSRMLNVGPWYRLPLTIRWLESEYECDFILKPPVHMEIVSGKVEIPKSQTSRQKNGGDDRTSPPRAIWAPECHLCMQRITDPERSRIGCINSLCKLTCHIICLANYILSSDESSNRGHYIPISGECPLCEAKFKWIDLLQRKRKLEANGVEQIEEEDTDGDYDDDCYDACENDDADSEINDHDFDAKDNHIEIKSDSDTHVASNGYSSPIYPDTPKYDIANDASKLSMESKNVNAYALLDATEQNNGNLNLPRDHDIFYDDDDGNDNIEILSDSNSPIVYNGYSGDIYSNVAKLDSANDDGKVIMDSENEDERAFLDAKEQKNRDLNLYKKDDDIIYELSD